MSSMERCSCFLFFGHHGFVARLHRHRSKWVKHQIFWLNCTFKDPNTSKAHTLPKKHMSETLNTSSPRGPKTSSVRSYKPGSPSNSLPRSQWERSAHPQHRDVTLHLTDSPSLVFSSVYLAARVYVSLPKNSVSRSVSVRADISVRAENLHLVTQANQKTCVHVMFFFTHRWYIETHTHSPPSLSKNVFSLHF